MSDRQSGEALGDETEPDASEKADAKQSSEAQQKDAGRSVWKGGLAVTIPIPTRNSRER
jgi:hypothetical protein